MIASNQKSSRVRAETRARREAGTAGEAAEVPLTTGNLGQLTSVAMPTAREFHVNPVRLFRVSRLAGRSTVGWRRGGAEAPPLRYSSPRAYDGHGPCLPAFSSAGIPSAARSDCALGGGYALI